MRSSWNVTQISCKGPRQIAANLDLPGNGKGHLCQCGLCHNLQLPKKCVIDPFFPWANPPRLGAGVRTYRVWVTNFSPGASGAFQPEPLQLGQVQGKVAAVNTLPITAVLFEEIKVGCQPIG